jgi:transposase
MSPPGRYCSLIPGFGVKLSAIILAGPTVLSAVGACPPHDGVRRRWWINVASAISLIESSQKIGRSHHRHRIRGLLKNVGLVIGRAKFNVFAVRAEELIEDRPELIAIVGPLLKARQAIEQTDDLGRKVLKLARYDAQVRRFMTVPGVGPITALWFKATIDDPTRFKRSRSVGAYVGLTTRRHASGEIDWTGRISKCGDAMLRSYLFEAASVLLTRVPKWSALKAWGMRLAKRNGLRKATVAVARKLAVILHRMWVDQTEFNWSKKEVAA